MRGRFSSLDQLYKKFTNEVFPSPRLNANQKLEKRSLSEFEVIFSRNQVKTKKKVFAGNLNHFFPKSGEDQKKGLRRNLQPFSAGNL